MAKTVVLERKPLSLSERTYLPQIVTGLKTTFSNLFKEKVTLQYLFCSIKDHSAIKDLNGLVSPIIDIVLFSLFTDTFVKKFSVVNLKFIDKSAEKHSNSFDKDLSKIST